jgi:hypothetical protein
MTTKISQSTLEAAFQAAHRRMNRPNDADARRPWICPLPELNGCAPKVLEPSLAEAFGDPENPDHPRILIVYPRYMFADLAPAFLDGTRSASTFFFLPSHTPLFAAQDGVISEAERTTDGFKVLVEHADGWATHYENLERIFCQTRSLGSRARAETVRAGDVLGYVGGSSLDVGAMCPLRFELWRHFRAIEPRPRMETWLLLPHTDNRLQVAVAAPAANVRLAA